MTTNDIGQADSLSLLDSLNNLNQEAEGVSEEPTVDAEDEASDTASLIEALAALGVPDGVVDQWKKQHLAVYVFAPAATDLFVWRPLVKNEWDQINQMMSKGDPNDPSHADKLERTVVQHCVLFPRLDTALINQSRAGLVSTLFEIIMAGSFFLSSQQAMGLVAEL